jgi:hypothetical protein
MSGIYEQKTSAWTNAERESSAAGGGTATDIQVCR